MARIGFGPLAPQWSSLDLLQQIVAAGREMGTLVHMHVAETLLQKVFALTDWGCSMIAFLAGHGLLGPELVIAHGVWLTEKDIHLLAAAGAGLTHQPSSNLRLKAGIAPVGPMIDAGVKVGIGTDGMGINDDDDLLQEMKLCYRLQGLRRLEPDSPALSAREVFKMATETNARLIGYGSELGRLEPGRKADMVLLDYERMCHPFAAPDTDPIDTLLYRGSREHIAAVIVNGRELLVDGRIRAVNESEISARLAAVASRQTTAHEKEAIQMTEALKTHLIKFYRGWTESVAAKPYYLLNSKRADRR
jgi:cytosine/adenosine deaminase-related metal-dependent hydrolase